MSLARVRQGFAHSLNVAGRASKESFQLVQAFWSSRDYKTVLLDQARQHENQTAAQILMLQKQISLIRYHGLPGYLRQTSLWQNIAGRFTLRNNPKPDSSEKRQAGSSTMNPQQTETRQKTAKVAFMITSSMKSELIDILGYEEAQIRTMTPTQASLVLENKVAPSELAERLPQLVKEHEESLTEQPKSVEMEASGEEVEGTDTLNGALASPSTVLASEDDAQPPPSREPSASPTSLADDSNHSEGSTNAGLLWYELVCSSGGEEEVVGLYRSQEEATFGRQVHEELTEGRVKRGEEGAKSHSFFIRSTRR